jgi:hypothetical protein
MKGASPFMENLSSLCRLASCQNSCISSCESPLGLAPMWSRVRPVSVATQLTFPTFRMSPGETDRLRSSKKAVRKDHLDPLPQI